MAAGRHLDGLGLSSESFSAQGASSRSAANLRRAVVLAALLLLSGLAALALNRDADGAEGRGALAQERLWSSHFTRTKIGQRHAQTATSQELTAAESGSAAAADAANVINSEKAAAAAPQGAAPGAPMEEGVPMEGEGALEEPAEGVAEPEGVVEGEQGAPEEGAADGAAQAAPAGFPFPSAGTQNMIEHPVDVGPGGQYEFPPGVVYNGPPVSGAGGHYIVNMAGVPRAGTAMIETPQEPGGLPEGLIKGLMRA
eukprot:CAMPEP_0206256794 /NCGR_PEP_ID=MMETSP0047_2-20121206/24979_1 /ASSEMBLY_ACC=CAM_ASM_000192 /TAXON_ID=195065 /ORGANISM="Chroomonas mesostigmatica_cf, Strain CCMP1168" /LENGTH=254 /DNA_ID=CAMNT_0053683301 /DNA_START=45 /DNA_END=806 /DNA_ORIENTATION=-